MSRDHLIQAIMRGPTPTGEHARDYDSPIERTLAYLLNKYRETGAGRNPDGTVADSDKEPTYLAAQIPLRTFLSDGFRGDLGMLHSDVTVLFEADGKEHHQDKVYEDLRTAAIFEDGLIDHMFRFSGTMLHHSPEDALYLTQQVLPQLFLNSANHPFRMLSTPTAQEVARDLHPGCGPVHLEYEAPIETNDYDDDGNSVYRPCLFTFTYVPRAAPTRRVGAYMDVIGRYRPPHITAARHLIEQELGPQ
ncbi:hypothetical protein IHN63_08935 [Deinococcus sp. 6YEL10]|uniref:hypothetical protein n=1 Tax=Deinococcus sp. 6YEL10 TaxID=2745870 RepID=UPI001E38D574|nr:hypothetical protein [Deinococcus sp. 6YEL10]MCD0161430.1 hypothetical protein [Deinococcus sp. 6YEL10]